MSLTQVLQQHRERKKKDNNAIMTIAIKPSESMADEPRLLDIGLFMAIDPNTKQLLCYKDDKANHAKEPTLEVHNSESEVEGTFFDNEVEATFLRAGHENIKIENVVTEVNSLKLSYNTQIADCAGAIFYSMMKLALEGPHDSASELVKATTKVIKDGKPLLKSYLPDKDEEIEVIMKFEEMCLESAKELSSVFDKILHQLYDHKVIQEEAILMWAEEKKDADESDRIFVFVRQVETFLGNFRQDLRWLRQAEEKSKKQRRSI